ncbi:MAG: hypothetical protein EBT30_08520 [Verrucomicrobia bacterium]|nr:hypothetical protein [Verrucomicrobiota bacterium]
MRRAGGARRAGFPPYMGLRVECDCRATILVAVYEAGRIPALQVAKKNQKIAFAALSIILKMP